MELMPTPRDTIHRDATATLMRFRRPEDAVASSGVPLLVVPSLINRWYVVDLRPGASLVGALVGAGLDTFCLDWGVPEDEDRYLSWEDVLGRLARAVRAVKRETGAEKIALLGYCMGGTLAGIHAALHPDEIVALVNLAGPFDFAHAGQLGRMTDPRWFDAAVIAGAGNIAPEQMQAGFVALRPTLSVAKWIGLADKALDKKARVAFEALERWSSDNVPFPAAAYVTYIQSLYQRNELVGGTHHVRGQRVELERITCPVLTIAADRDTICPLDAARGLHDHVGSQDKELVVVAGGHVGAVVGSRATRELHPKMTTWLRRHLCSSIN